jgi:RND family efflux transporter MFP subunit
MVHPLRLRSLLPLVPLAFVLAACRGAAPDAAAAESQAQVGTAVRMGKVERDPVVRPVHGTGVVRLKSETDLSFKVGGVVTSVAVDEGARVKKGQVLARINPTEVTAALTQAQEGATKAERDLERATRLHGMGAIPVAELQNAQTGAKLARAAVEAASFNAERATIVAPDDGRIDRRLIEPGEVVGPGQPAFHVSGRSKGAIVRIGLTDRDVLRLHDGDDARVVLDARPSLPLAAKVSQIATVASPGSGTFDVEVKLAEPPEGLLSGLTAKVAIELVDKDAVATVPVSAIVDGRAEKAAVFSVENGHAKKVPVKVAFLTGERAALSSLPEGMDLIVAKGALDLEDGAVVRVMP